MAGRNEIRYHIVAKDYSSPVLGKTEKAMESAGKAAADMGKDMAGAADHTDLLNARLTETQAHLRDLALEFQRTGDMGLFRDIRRDKRTINQVRQMQRIIGEVTADAGQAAGESVTSSILSGLATLPARLGPYGIAVGAAIGVAAAPVVGGALAAGVLGGVGSAGIIGGIVAAAQDPAVKDAGTALGQSLGASFTAAGEPFIEPLIASMGQLEDIGADFAADLRREFAGLAPLLKPLTEGLGGFLDELGPGLSDAFRGAQPVIRALSHELPRVGDAISDALSAMADESDGATMALLSLLRATESIVRDGGELLGWLSGAYEDTVRFTAGWTGAMEDIVGWMPIVGDKMREGNDRYEDLIASLDDATDASGDFSGAQGEVAAAADRATEAMIRQHEELIAQTDPMFGLVDALKTVRDRQADYNEAVKEHGPKSQEARDASLRLAQAAIAAQGAAGDAAGAFDGELTPAMRDVLTTAGLTKRQINDVTRAFRSARAAGDRFAKTYTAHARVVIDGGSAFGGGAFEGLGFRASGGPVQAGRPYVVGEDGPEVVRFDRDGYVHNAAETRSMLSGGAGYGAIAAAQSYRDVKLPNATGGFDRLFLSMLQEFMRANPGVRLVST